MAGCVPKKPPVSTANGKPAAAPVPDRLAAVEAVQSAIKARQDAQESAITALQAHMALLDSRLDMIEYSLHIGKGSPFAQASRKAHEPQPPMAYHIAPASRPAPPKPVAAKAPTKTPAKAPLPSKAPPKPVAAKPPAQPVAPKAPAMSKADQAKMQKAFDDAMLSLKSGDYEKATTALASFVRQYPDTAHAPEARYWLGEALFAQMQVAKAVDALKPFASMPVTTPKRAPALFRLGAGYQRLGSKTDAARVFTMLRHDYPGTIEANNATTQLKALGIIPPAAAPRPQSRPQPRATARPAARPAATAPVRQHWAVNIVSLDTRADARRMLSHLRRQGLHATMMKVRVAGKLWYRLHLTGYAGRPAAERERLKVIKRGYADAWVSPG